MKSASINKTLSSSKTASVPVIPEDARKAQGKIPRVEFQKPTGNSREMRCNREPVMSLNVVKVMDTVELLLEVPQGPARETLRQAVQGEPILTGKSSEVCRTEPDSRGIAAAAETTTCEQLSLISPRVAEKPLATMRLGELGEREFVMANEPEELWIEQLLDD